MTYAALMVHMQLGVTNAAVLAVAGNLAQRFDATLIGIAGCQPMPIGNGGGYWSGQAVEQCRLELERETQAAEAEFRDAMRDHAARLSWRSTITMNPLADILAREARSADLLLTGVVKPVSMMDTSRQVNLGDLVMQAGRPLLVVPDAAVLGFDTAVVGWKDTREARRAVADALPLLRRTAQVLVVEIAAEDDCEDAQRRVDDVAAWLERHGVKVEASAKPWSNGNEAGLQDIADQHGADFIVAGAYGHSRLREWALGGMTRRLITHPGRCSLLSH